MDSDVTKKKMIDLVNPKDDFIRVKFMRKIRNGGVLIENSDKEGAEKIKDNAKLKESGLSATTPRKNNLKIVIYDVYLGFEEVCEGLCGSRIPEI